VPSRVTLLLLSLLAASAVAQKTPIRIAADLTDAPRKLYHAEVHIPVAAGALTLTTPKWIPGHHTPVGPVADIAGIVFSAGGKTLEWRRDDLDLYEYHLTIPSGVTMLDAHLDCIVTARNTANIAALQWEKLLLYPANVPVNQILVQASVTVPKGWGVGTSLSPLVVTDPNHPAGGTITYEPTTVGMLEDSPVITGQYFHEYALAPEITPKHFLDVFGSTQAETELRPQVTDAMSKLVREAWALYDSHHYNSYHFLLTLNHNAGGGVEHHESSDNGMTEDALDDDAGLSLNGAILPHEFTHSWNGKFRRAAGEVVPDFATPMKSDLLWVYEGLTDYLGNMLAARAGFFSTHTYREALALEAAKLDYEPGRTWRSTEDTAISVTAFRLNNMWTSSGPAWGNWRRNTDYYQEGDLLWLDVDTTIRKLTGDRKSLRDFLVLFLGNGVSTGPEVVPYDFDEIVKDLNEVVKNDWAAFLNDRVRHINVHADYAGIEQGGYKLVYTDQPTAYERTLLARRGDGVDAWFSLGLSLDHDGVISDIRTGGPADKAQLAPGEKIMAINGRVYSRTVLHDAIQAGKTSSVPMQFIVQNDAFVSTATVDYHGGERFPSLVRVSETPAYLDEIIMSLTHD
jgi:predicted metalloprotease with PDZ domain